MRADDGGGWEWLRISASMCFVCVRWLYNHDAKIPIMNLSFDIVNIIRSRHPINSFRCLQYIRCKQNESQTKHNRLGFLGPMNSKYWNFAFCFGMNVEKILDKLWCTLNSEIFSNWNCSCKSLRARAQSQTEFWFVNFLAYHLEFDAWFNDIDSWKSFGLPWFWNAFLVLLYTNI